MQKNVTAFALDNDGFKFALAAANGAGLESFSSFAKTSWEKSNNVVIAVIKQIKQMNAFTTASILSLHASFRLANILCDVSFYIFISIEDLLNS